MASKKSMPLTLDDLASACRIAPIDVTAEFTVKQFAERTNLKLTMAQIILAEMADLGIVLNRPAITSGRACRAWRVSDDATIDDVKRYMDRRI